MITPLRGRQAAGELRDFLLIFYVYLLFLRLQKYHERDVDTHGSMWSAS